MDGCSPDGMDGSWGLGPRLESIRLDSQGSILSMEYSAVYYTNDPKGRVSGMDVQGFVFLSLIMQGLSIYSIRRYMCPFLFSIYACS